MGRTAIKHSNGLPCQSPRKGNPAESSENGLVLRKHDAAATGQWKNTIVVLTQYWSIPGRLSVATNTMTNIGYSRSSESTWFDRGHVISQHV